MGKTAIILGATGLTGSILLQKLLDDGRYDELVLFSRSGTGITHPQLREHIGDLLELEQFRNEFKANEVFCCIGTTRAKTRDRAMYRKIDLGIPLAAARLCKENQIPVFIVISALGAHARSPVFYSKLKGEMEARITALQLARTHILKPSLIAGKRKERRIGEWVAMQAMQVLNLVMVGPLKKYQSIYPETIADCMIWLANNHYDKIKIKSNEIRRIAES